MLVDDIADRIAIACPAEIDAIIKDMWADPAHGLLTDNEIETLDEAARARREAIQTRRTETRPKGGDDQQPLPVRHGARLAACAPSAAAPAGACTSRGRPFHMKPASASGSGRPRSSRRPKPATSAPSIGCTPTSSWRSPVSRGAITACARTPRWASGST